MRNIYFIVMLCLVTSGCARLELASHFAKRSMGPGEKSEGLYKVGSPYTINGKRYYPEVDYSYKKTGIASWYGPGFHGKKTANGEVFNENDLTAAHKTLPLPSIIEVTNLENGKKAIMRVNDRGPYAHGRILDVSKHGAEVLGFKNKGTAKVKIEVMKSESIKVAQIARRGESTQGYELALNDHSKHPPYTTQRKIVQKPVYQQPKIYQQASYTAPIPPPPSTQKLFVQAGAFSTREGAMKYSSALSDFGRAQIFPTNVNGVELYRVRFPVNDASSADNLLSSLTGSGYKNAMIVMD